MLYKHHNEPAFNSISVTNEDGSKQEQTEISPGVHHFLQLLNPSCLSLGKLSFLSVNFLFKIWYYDG